MLVFPFSVCTLPLALESMKQQQEEGTLMSPSTAQEISFLTEPEAAKFIRLASGTLQNKRVQGSGPPFYKFGSRVLYSRQDLLSWANTRRRTSTSDGGAD